MSHSSPRNTRSAVIGILLATLSAGCLIAFTLVASNAEYPTPDRVQAAQPEAVAAPVILSDRSSGDPQPADRIRPGRSDDPNVPIVLGIRVRKQDDRDRRGSEPRRSPRRDEPSRNGGRGADTDSPDPGASVPELARPDIQWPDPAAIKDKKDRKDRKGPPIKLPNGNALGHDKKANPAPPAGAGSTTGATASAQGGPPAHAGGDDAPAVSSGNPSPGGPPAHAGPPDHATSSSTPSPESAPDPASNGSPPAHSQAGAGDASGAAPAEGNEPNGNAYGHDKEAKS